MSAIHYKFSSSNDYKNVTFDGMSISVQDCKTAIMQKEKLKMTEVDLLITNAQSLKDYREETALIPKNTALLVRRIPIGAAPASDTSKVYIVKRNESAASKKSESSYMTLDQLRKTDDLAAANATEQDKIKAMMDQSTTEYDPSKYLRPPRPGSYQRYDSNVHLPHVKCFKCNQTGHYSSQCRLSRPLTERAKSIRPATGIPRSHMVQVNKDARGAMLTPDGQYVVPFIDKKGYEIGKKEKPPFLPETKEIKEDDEDEPVPDELICLLCKEIMEDAVVIPCCGNSYCDDCIRNALLESEDHECPTCHKKNISPDSLIANKFLRQAVIKFLNETGISRKKSNAPVWPRPAPVEPKPPRQPQPTKVTYGPPKPKSQAAQPPTTSGPYVVKARSAQIYAAQGYTIKKATSTTLTNVVSTVVTPTVALPAPVTQEVVKQEASVTPADSVLDSSASPLTSEESAKGVQPVATVKTEPKISPLNMMVERPTTESPPPPPPPPLVSSHNADQPEIAETLPTAAVESPAETIPVEPVEEPPAEEPIEQPSQPPPPVLDDMPPEVVTHFSVQPNGINITLKNPPPIPEKPEPVLIVDPPLNVPMPAQRAAAALLAASVASRPPMMMPMTVPPPRMGLIPHGIRVNIPPPTGTMVRNHPRHMIPTSIRPPTIPTSIPPPGLMRPLVQRIGIPPPMNLLPPGVMPHHMPFPPPPGIPPPGYLQHPVSSASSLVSIEGHSAPPPPGTGTPPSLAAPAVRKERKRGERRSSSRTKHENKENKPSSKSRQSKLALMSDEFTRKLKEKPAPRGRRPKRGRSANRSGSESYSSSSYSSSSSRSSFSSSGTSSYSTSGSSRSRSRTPARRRKKREAGRRSRKTESYSESRSPSPARRKRGKNISSKYRKDSRSPKRANRSRRRRVDASPRRESRHHERRRRSRSRDRRRSTSVEESVIPGMPPQSVLDYERDLALYEYYKQKYEQDWLRNRIYPPSPFKRFITYNPTKIPPPNVQSQPVLREVAPHPGPISMQGHPSMYSQPPPPGDATPTEEDAGMYAFRDRTPERFLMRQGPGPWEQPMFDGDPAQRARVLQEEEYYARMQNKLQGEQGWNQRGGSYPDPRFDPRGRPDPRERGRLIDDRDRRRSGRTPPVERGRRSWEQGGDRWPSRERRREEDLRRGHYRDSREGDWDGRRSQKDSRSSRREDQTRGPRKRGNEAESSRGGPEPRKRSRGTKRTENPENLHSEPFPPGEGDATPVRDETRVEITNESIKVKVINDRVKQKSDRKKEREKVTKVREISSRRGDKVHLPAEKRLSDSKSRRPVKPVGKKAAPVKEKEEPKVVPTAHEDNRPEFVPPAAERSPTPTLDENVSPIQFDDVPDVLDVHARASVSEIEQHVPLRRPEDAPKKTESRITKKNEDRLGKERERRRAKKPPPKRVVTKQQKKVPTSSVCNEARDIKEKSAEATAKELIEAIVPKSRWESDNESPVKISSKEMEPEMSPTTQKSPEVKLVKQRKIRIKKPSMKLATDPIKAEKQMELEPSQKSEMITKDAMEKQEKDTNSQGAADSRRVVVSNDSQMIEKPASKSVRMLRPTISQTDETTFEPDYNDNESENALSNYAPSDFEEEEKRAKNGIRKKESSDQKYHQGKRHEEDGEGEDSGEERSDEAYEKSKKKKKKKKKKRRKHHRQYDDDDDFEDEDTFHSDSEEVKYEQHSSKSRKEEKRRDVKSKKHDDDDDEQTETRVYSRSKKERRYSEKGHRDYRHNVGSSGRKRKSERGRTDGYSDGESGEIEDKRSRRRSHRSPKEKRRRLSEKDEISLEDDSHSLDDEQHPEEKRKHKKKQKHKKSKREPKESSKEVKTVASRIRNSK